MNEKKNKKIFYIIIAAVAVILLAGGGTYAYFAASAGNNNAISGTTNDISSGDLSLTVTRVDFNNTSASSDELIPVYFGKTNNSLNVINPSMLNTTYLSRMITNKCEKDGNTLCHVYNITARSTKSIAEANLYLDLEVSGATDKMQWGYALFTETGDIANGETTGLSLFSGSRTPLPIGNGVTNLDVNDGGSLVRNTPVTYYLIVYLNDNQKVQNETGDNYAVGTYNGSVSLKAMDGEVKANFFLPTSLTDFEYAIGSYTTPKGEVTIPSNQVFLTKYIGDDSVVNIPATYTINGVEYSTALYGYQDHSIEDCQSVFKNNTTIKQVSFDDNVLFASNNIDSGEIAYGKMVHTFLNCSSLTNVTNYPDNVNIMVGTFRGCTSLVSVPAIPNSVIHMSQVFYGCTSLVTAPDLSNANSLVNMREIFRGCRSLVNVSAIPSGVTNMFYAFADCESLTSAPNMSNATSVTNIEGIFYNCYNLVGNINIGSPSISNASGAFTTNTTKNINVSVPAGSTTYTTLTSVNIPPSNVTVLER